MKENNDIHIIVTGAGVMGCWTAWQLQRRGARVTLIDPWGPGHSRSSSGGETRIMRSIYGPHRIYVKMVQEAMEEWRKFEAARQISCFEQTGALWMFSEEDNRYLKNALPLLAEFDLPIRQLDLQELHKTYPQINFEGIHTAWLEEQAGFLHARFSCQQIVKALLEEGGAYRQAMVKPGAVKGEQLQEVFLSNGEQLQADAYVFACGPWLPKLFPEFLAAHLQITRQEVYFFAPPAGAAFQYPALPVWLEFGSTIYYGIPDGSGRGFKVADDIRNHTHFDPQGDDRIPTPERLAQARAFLARRLPQIAGAPLIESRVCQYTCSPDGHLILDRHPEAKNTWIAGAGSGHAFKLGPAIGNYLAGRIFEELPEEATWGINRLDKVANPLYNQFEIKE